MTIIINHLTKEFCKRVLNYWVDVFHVDGFRFDLSKGFTQNYTLGDIDGWSNYDQSRIDILTEYASDVWQNSPGTYMILEFCIQLGGDCFVKQRLYVVGKHES